MDTERHGHITSVAVARSHRKLGIATRLMLATRKPALTYCSEPVGPELKLHTVATGVCCHVLHSFIGQMAASQRACSLLPFSFLSSFHLTDSKEE